MPNQLQTTENTAAAAIETGFTPAVVVTCKVVRESGVLYGYYNDNVGGGEAGSWTREDSWGAPGDGFSFSGDCYLVINGDAAYSGFGMLEVKGDLFV